MVNSDADATPQMTPPRDSAFRAEAWIKSIPQAISSVELESKLDKCLTLIGNVSCDHRFSDQEQGVIRSPAESPF